MNLLAHHISDTHLLMALCQPEERVHAPNRERERQIKRCERGREGEREGREAGL